MATFFYKRALLKKGSEEFAKGILVKSDKNDYVIWYSKGQPWMPSGGFHEDFPILSSTLNTWTLGEAESIDALVCDWNSGIRSNIALTNEIACASFFVEKGDIKVWNGDEWNVNFDDVEWVQPPMCGGFISDKYDLGTIYSGQGSYHSHHGQHLNAPVEDFKGHRIGVELEVECKTRADFNKVTATKSNWFYQERDGSLGPFGDEIITIPLLPKDAKSIEFWKPLITFLNKHAESWRKTTCGLHVHIGREILGKDAEARSETLGKLLYFYHHLIDENPTAKLLNEKVYGRAHTYSEQSGKSEIGNAVRVLGQEILKDKAICDKLKKGMTDASSGGRYYDINLENLATIEFRKGKGSISAERITAIVAWSEGMVDYCRKTPWTQLNFNEFVEWIKERRGTPSSLKGFLTVDA